MRLTVILAFAFMTMATSGYAAQAATPDSWGKLNISYLQYRTDIAECGYAIVNMKIDPQTPDNLAVNMTPTSDAPSLADIQEMALQRQENTRRYLRDLKLEIVTKAQAELDACLAGRGYSRFRLTAEQALELQSAPSGTQARQKFLYRLASDPQVLSRQPY